MNRIPRQQRRKMGLGLVIAGVALIVTVGVVVAGARLILNSNDGEEIDSRALEGPVRFLPESSTALIGVVNESGRLTSAAVLALSPDGVGGAIMPMSASADVGADQTEVLRPLAATVADREQGAGNFLEGAESISNITFDHAELVDAARFEELFGPLGEVEVSLNAPVVDSATGTNWAEGPQTLAIADAARLLTATNFYAQDWYYDPARYGVWRGIAVATGGGADGEAGTSGSTPPTTAATTVPATPTTLPSTIAGGSAPANTDPFTPPATMDEFVARLLQGTVVERGLGITAVEDRRVLSDLDPELVDAFGDAGVPSVVVHNMSEVAVVGSAIAPGRVGATRDGPNYRLVAAFTDADLEEFKANDPEGRDFTRADVVKQAVDRLAFSGSNIPSVVILDEPARDVTLIEVAKPDELESAKEKGITMFGEQIEVTTAAEPIVGIDVEVVLGRSYLETVGGRQTGFEGPFTMELSSLDPLSLSPAPTEAEVAPKATAPVGDDLTEGADGDGSDSTAAETTAPASEDDE